MKSLILKDLYNIGHNTKQMVLMLLFLAICFVPTSDAYGYIIMCALMCGMMIATTFAFDAQCKWESYALVMPVTRKEYVVSKYLVAGVFVIAGILFGSVGASGYKIFKGSFDIKTLLVSMGAAVLVGLFFTSLYIPFLIKMGAEKARMILIGVVAIPSIIIYVIYKLMMALHVAITEEVVMVGIIVVPIVLILIVIGSVFISIKLFRKMEF